MADKEYIDMLNQLAGTYLAIEELNNAVPKLNKDVAFCEENIKIANEMLDESKILLDSTENAGKRINKDIEKGTAKLEKAVAKMEEISSSIKEKVDELPDLDGIKADVMRIEDRLKKLEEEYEKKLSRLEKELHQEIENYKKYEYKRSDDEDEDDDNLDDIVDDDNDEEDVLYTLQELYDMYGTGVTVVDDRWHGDYCFAVDAIVDGIGYGINLRNGKMQPIVNRIRMAPANISLYKLYEGKYQDAIDELIRNEDVAGFWKNRGFEIEDNRPKGKGKYLYVRGKYKDLEPWSEVVREIFEVKGRLYDEYWASNTSK